MRIVKFYPQDVLFFRDAKPFDAGGDNTAISAYPMPSVFYGALRTALIGNDLQGFKNGKYKEFIGTPTEHGKFRAIGPFIFKDSELFFPIPKNISQYEMDSDKKAYVMLKPLEKGNYAVKLGGRDVKLHKLWHRSYESIKDPKIKYVDFKTLNQILEGKIENLKEVTTYMIENRIGIKLDKEKNAAKERYLYRESTMRFYDGCGFAAFVENDRSKLDDVKSVSLGGERHIAFTKVENFELPNKTMTGKIMIYLATPAIFENGFLPKSFDGENILINGAKCKLVSIANSKPITVSTFDIVKNKPRASKLAVPAGSVYFVETQENISANGFLTFTDEMEEYGFGRALIGGWDYE